MCKSKCVCFNQIIMKMGVKMKNGSQRYDMNRTSLRHGHKYTKYKMCLRDVGCVQ